MEEVKQHKALIVVLAVIACFRPLMNILGLSAQIGQPMASVSATVIITLAWIATVVFVRIRQPVVVLMFAGIVYVILAIVLSAVLSPILTGHLQGPITNPFAIVGVLVTNAVWGIIAGFLATVLMRVWKL
ncbi:hypothetical protein [Paenibacillus ginsengarvi]|uniref:Uncharacterized protein n=1 Tax=Paenibacillus ginsengarvi TaxID=400777 RepID=A0A3B0AZQ9_9BACL|nr:hypothetical protein [Paenibacillus ginsengarvi]RKN66035.1 hypothetical protein D7M11_31670 [Paenibacillus ginsengarvi]